MPLQALLAVLQRLVPLHELIPLQWTDLLIFLASAGAVAAPLRTRAIAAAATDAPETILRSFPSPCKYARHTSAPGPRGPADAIRHGQE